MYRCDECGAEFETPDYGYLSSEYWGIPKTERYDRCPRCKGILLLKLVTYCHICDSPIYEGDTYYKIKDGTYVCENCVQERTAKL